MDLRVVGGGGRDVERFVNSRPKRRPANRREDHPRDADDGQAHRDAVTHVVICKRAVREGDRPAERQHDRDRDDGETVTLAAREAMQQGERHRQAPVDEARIDRGSAGVTQWRGNHPLGGGSVQSPEREDG